MKHKYKDKCDICGEWKNDYVMVKKITVCDDCATKRNCINKVMFFPLDEELGEVIIYETI